VLALIFINNLPVLDRTNFIIDSLFSIGNEFSQAMDVIYYWVCCRKYWARPNKSGYFA